MLRRPPNAVFASGCWVFPGGAVDPDDRRSEWAAHCGGLDSQLANQRLCLETGAEQHYIAAVRECFEEVGILLAKTADGQWVDIAHSESREDFLSLCMARRWILPLDHLVYYTHWVTPEGEPRRFSTRFFTALAPPDAQPVADHVEALDACWISPQETLRRYQNGDFALMPPTRAQLKVLAGYDDAESFISEMAQINSVRCIAPELQLNEQGKLTGLILKSGVNSRDHAQG